MKIRFLPLILLCLLLGGCSRAVAGGHLISAAEGSEEYCTVLNLSLIHISPAPPGAGAIKIRERGMASDAHCRYGKRGNQMPAQITNYQCPACTGPLHFVGESGKLECEYCGSGFDAAEIEALYAEKEARAAAAGQSDEGRPAPSTGGEWDTSGLSEDWGCLLYTSVSSSCTSFCASP